MPAWAQVEDMLEEAEGRPEEIQRAAVAASLEGLHHDAVGGIRLGVEGVPKCQLAHDVVAQSLAPRGHVDYASLAAGY